MGQMISKRYGTNKEKRQKREVDQMTPRKYPSTLIFFGK